MKSYEVKYVKGHLIDNHSGKRIFLKRGGTFNILADDDQFEEKDELQAIDKPLNSEEKLAALKNEFKDFHFQKIGDAGTEFIYRIGLAKKTSEDKAQKFLFNAVIKEDLFLKSKDEQEWSLCPCLCETTECLEGNVQMIESVPGNSLSNLFANVVTFYFAFQRSTACNALTAFYFKKPLTIPTLNNVKNRYINSIDEYRQAIIKNHSKGK